MSSFVHIDKKKKTIGLDETTLTVKAQYSINFS